MEMGEVIQAIGSVGFPIVMCLIIMYYWNNQFSTMINKLSDTVSQLKDVVSDNTKIIEVLRDTLEDMRK